jgi:hypothetical protein
MTEEELKDSARAWWVLSAARAARYQYVVAVADGYVVGLFRIVDGSWRSIDGRRFGKTAKRWGFDVEDVSDDMWRRIVGQQVPNRPNGDVLFGSGSIIAYWPE